MNRRVNKNGEEDREERDNLSKLNYSKHKNMALPDILQKIIHFVDNDSPPGICRAVATDAVCYGGELPIEAYEEIIHDRERMFDFWDKCGKTRMTASASYLKPEEIGRPEIRDEVRTGSKKVIGALQIDFRSAVILQTTHNAVAHLSTLLGSKDPDTLVHIDTCNPRWIEYPTLKKGEKLIRNAWRKGSVVTFGIED